MRKRALLILATALLVAAAGVVYAHWQDTLLVQADVYTGDLEVNWIEIFTDDDTGNSIGEETGFSAPLYCFFTFSGGGPACGSRDPAQVGWPNFANTDLERYDKDVAQCVSGISDGSAGMPAAGTMWVQALNTYPSYHCTIWSRYQNQGSVPVKVQSVEIHAFINDVEVPGFGSAGEWDTLQGHFCGMQIDPGEIDTTINTFHILNDVTGANMNQHYEVTQKITFVNWNEWSAANCNGLPLTPVRPPMDVRS